METSLLLKLFESIGFPAVIFVIWYVYHNAQVKTFEKIISNNFEIPKEMLETNHLVRLSFQELKVKSMATFGVQS